jgi:hypothetical protein
MFEAITVPDLKYIAKFPCNEERGVPVPRVVWWHAYSRSDEYTGSNGAVSAATTHIGHVIDTTRSTGGNQTSTILAEVCRAITNPDPSGNGYYAVYTDTPRGHDSYCAYHSYGTCGGVPVQFAFFFDLDGDAGCDPQDTSGLHSQGLAALANVSGHELSEARTDPASPGAWYDSSGAENGDKCAWTFNVPPGDLQQRHAVENPGRVVECRVHGRYRISQQLWPEGLSRRLLERIATKRGSNLL